jgi:hypothetical protein
MPATGYGSSLTGAALGTFPNVKDIKLGGLEVEMKEVACVTDTDKIPTKLPNKVRDGNIDLTMVYDAGGQALYNQLRTYAKGHTQDNFTLTDSTASVHAGLGYVQKVGELQIDTDNEEVYLVTLTPVTTWAFTPAS